MVDVERVEVMLSPELAERIDWIVDLLGFESREKFVEAAVRRLVDQYMLIVAR
jgi:metal-responsive CopG/Arc/MetJ family transcriptional regulator